MTKEALHRVTQIGTRKGNRPVIRCPDCGYKVALNRKDEIDTHYKPIGGGRLSRCSMSSKAVYLHLMKREEQGEE